MARASTPRAAPRKRRADELIVNLDEFASLCGVTPETMRGHLKVAPADAKWILERGARGRGYKIAAQAALEWWRKRTANDGEDADRRQRLAELRLQMMGGDAGEEDVLLTGKQRYEEYRAGEAELAYRQAIGELARLADIENELVNSVIELRRQLQGVGRSIRRKFGLDRDVESAIDELIGKRLKEFVKALDVDDESIAGAG
jgi:phage terminase Nu1 subunit (DNA packaging protein)